MKYLSDDEAVNALKYIDEAIKIAKNATCQRSKCGAIIVANDIIIGDLDLILHLNI